MRFCPEGTAGACRDEGREGSAACGETRIKFLPEVCFRRLVMPVGEFAEVRYGVPRRKDKHRTMEMKNRVRAPGAYPASVFAGENSENGLTLCRCACIIKL